MRPWGLLLLLAATSALYLIPGLDGWTRVGLPVLAALVVAARLASVRVARFIAAAICAFMGLVFLVGLSFVGWSLQPPSDAAVMTLVGVIAATFLAALLMLRTRDRSGAYVALGVAAVAVAVTLPRGLFAVPWMAPLALAAWIAWPTRRPAPTLAPSAA